ncbi:hypothetical protein NSMS1_29680 [Nostoc sp. MS1]|nr:hypothetical protein NSMS1_29680 [Nostoc sp. MS1]
MAEKVPTLPEKKMVENSGENHSRKDLNLNPVTVANPHVSKTQKSFSQLKGIFVV